MLTLKEIIDDFEHRNDDEERTKKHLRDKERDYRVNAKARKSCIEGQTLEEACPYIEDPEYEILVDI